MDSNLWIGLAIALGVVLAVAFKVRASRGAAESTVPRRALTPEEVITEVRGLLAENRKIEAIKLYRDVTRTELKTAKEAVEAIAAGQSPTAEPVGGSTALTPRALERITRLVAEDKEIEAIKVYRDLTNASLKDAKDAVEAIAAGMGK